MGDDTSLHPRKQPWSAANNRKPINKENQMKNDGSTDNLKKARSKIELVSKTNEPSYWQSDTNNRVVEGLDKANDGIEDLDENTFKVMHPDYLTVYPTLLHSLEECQKQNQVGIAEICTTVNALSDLFIKGMRIIIPTLIPDVFAAYILGMKTEELHDLRSLHRYRFNSQIYYLNTDVYDYLDRCRHGKQED